MEREKIGHYSKGYAILRRYVSFLLRIFYRRVSVQGMKNIPEGEPVIFTPNHQNALMDALAIVCTVTSQPVFLARSDIFKGKLVISLLTFFKILPVYRIRDGAASLQKNNEIFNKVLNVLLNKRSVGIMPEGNHGDQRKLRPIGKGVFRMAFQTQEKLRNGASVLLIPTGLDYSNYQKFNQDLLVNYGEPIRVADYMDMYRTEPVKATNELKRRLIEGMSHVMIDIQNKEYYQTIQDLRGIRESKIRKGAKQEIYKKFLEDKEMISSLENFAVNYPDKMKELDKEVSEYRDLLNKLKLRSWVAAKAKYSFLKLLIQGVFMLLTLPLFITGFILNYLPFKIPVLATKNVKDPQFVSSFKFVIMLIVSLVYYLILLGIYSIFIHDIWMWLSAWVATPLTAFFAFRYYVWFRKIVAKWRYSAGIRKRKVEYTRLRELFVSINQLVNEAEDQVRQ